MSFPVSYIKGGYLMKKTKMLVITASIVLGLSAAVEAKLPANAIVVGSNVYDISYLTSNISKINDEVMNNLGSIFYVDSNNVTKDIFTGSTLDDSQIVNRVGNTLNYYTSSGTVQKLVADSNNEFDPNGINVGDLSAVINITYKKITVGSQTLYAYTVKVTQVLGLQDAAYFSIDTSSTVPLTQVNTYIGTALTSTPKLTIYDTKQKDIASGSVMGVSLGGDSGTIDVPVSLHYDGSQQIETGNGNSSVNLVNTGFSVVDSDNEWMYYVNTADKNKLYKKSVSGVDNSPISDDKVGYINLLGDWVYYINYTDDSKIYKVRTDGTQKQKVADDMASCLNILSGKIYYINHSDRARIYVIDSQGRRQLCSDSASMLSAGSNNFLYYVNTLDDNKLYKYLLTNSTKSTVSDVSVQFLNVLGDSSVFYTGKNGLLYASSGSYYSNPNGVVAVTNVPTGKGNSTTLKPVNDILTVICAEDDNNIYYKSYVDSGKLYKLDKRSGNGYKIVDDSVEYVNIIGDYIYYTKSGKLYYVPKDSDGTVKGTAVTKPKLTLKISKLGTIDTIRTDDINKVNFPDRVAATMSDNSTAQLVVNWDKTIPKPSKGVYTFKGTILGYGNKVSLNVILDSGVIDINNVTVVNGVGSKDTVTVTKLSQGDIISIYTNYTDTKPIKTATAAANGTAVASGLNLNSNGDYLYITVTRTNKSEGEKSAYMYGPEAPVNFSVDAVNGKITGLKSGMSYKVFLETIDPNTGSLPDVPDSSVEVTVGNNGQAASDGSISVEALKSMTDLKQLRIVATNGNDSAPSAAVEVGKPKLDGVSVDLTNSRILGTTVDMEYSYAYDSVTSPNPSDWTACSTISTPVSMTRSLQVSVRKKANGPYLQSDIATYGLFPAPVVTGITDGGTYSIGSDLTVVWPANVDDSNGKVTYTAVLYNLTDNTTNTSITNVTGNNYSSDLIKLNADKTATTADSIIKTTDITGTGKNYKLVVTAVKETPSGLKGQSQTTINFAVTAGKPQTVDISMVENPGTMKKNASDNWVSVDPTTDALTYYNATPRWTDYPSTSSTAVIQRLELESVRNLSQVDLNTIKVKDWNSAAKVSFAPNTPVTQDGYYKLTVTSQADDNKATTDTIKYFIVDTTRIPVLPKIDGITDNGTYSAGITAGITITEDTTKGESLTIPTLIRDGYVTQLLDTNGDIINPTEPGSAAVTSGAITLKGTYQLDLNTVNVVNGKKDHKTYNFYVDNTATVSDPVASADISVPDNNTVEVNNIPYGSTIKVYSSSGSLLGSATNYSVSGSVSVTISGGIPANETSIYVTRTDSGKQESNRTQYALTLSPSIKSISPTVFNEVDNTGAVKGTVSGTPTDTIAVEIQNGTVNGAVNDIITAKVTVTTGALPTGLTYKAVKLDDTHIGIVIEGTASSSEKTDSISNLVFTIDESAISPTTGGTSADIQTTPVTINFNSAPAAVTNVEAADIGNDNKGSDLQVKFNAASDESTKVGSYRIFVVKHGKTFNLAAANAVSSANYTTVGKTGGNITTTLSATAKDTDGAVIANGTAYDIYVLSVANGTNANLNALSTAKSNFTLTNAPLPVIFSVAGKTTSPATLNDETPDVVVKGVSAGNTVTVYDGSNDIGSGTVAVGSTTITITTSALSVSSHTLTVKATDDGSIINTSTPFVYIVDKTITLPTTDGSSTSSSLVLKAGGTETDWASVAVTSGGTASGTKVASSVSGGNTCTINGIVASDGQTVIFTITDNAGNTKSFTATWNESGSSWDVLTV
ncbi:hypothetical protein CKR_1003 [Clostridium kluyveri NBRC 12016]|uniref:Predicted surface-layer protein n=3 Tax=Clostridium kluyveri TaxID=1534 RepID=A5N763_CLOK5|nr:Predicted surface-layer protein [Clostridium kluyveri DSM 555]BAH06054.1 hypothetical protein CKR_1003 [Clostridium kluyveri NBRC 12016]